MLENRMLENRMLQDEINYDCNTDEYEKRMNALAERDDESYEDEIFERLGKE